MAREQKPTLRKRGTAFAALLLIAGGGLYFFLQWREGGARRIVNELSSIRQIVAYDGIVFIAGNEPGKTERKIEALSGETGAPLPTAPRCPPEMNGDLYPEKDALYAAQFILSPPRTFAGVPGGGITAGSAIEKGHYLGEFALPSTIPPPGEKYRSLPLPGSNKGEVFLWRLPINGDSPTKIRLDTQGVLPGSSHLSLVGKAFYWVRLNAACAYYLPVKSGYYQAYPQNGELWRSPLDGGPAQLVTRNVSSNDSLSGNRKIVALMKRNPYPDTTFTLHCRRIADGPQAKEIILPDFRGITTPIEFENRLYWIEPEAQSGEDQGRYDPALIEPALQTRIVSEAWGGGDHRVVIPCRDDQGRLRAFRTLRFAGDRLYALYLTREINKNPRGFSTGTTNDQAFIARLFPDKLAALGPAQRLPTGGDVEQAVCDKTNLYLPVTREDRGPGVEILDLLSSNSVPGKIVNPLYRVTLP